MAHIYLDASDVVEYFSYNVSASGIQRVQLEFIRYFSNKADVSFVVENEGLLGFIEVGKDLLGSLVTIVDMKTPTRPELNKIIRLIRDSSQKAMPKPGDIFFVSGAFWISSSTSRSWLNAKKHGAKVGFLCYDLIPMTHPEFCDEGLVAVFSHAIYGVLNVADFIFTISEHVKTEVEKQLEQMGLKVPVIALPLAHELAPVKGEQKIRAEVLAVRNRKYVLFVSTIEARKNHAYTLTLWQRLLKDLPADDVPELVWVGRPGWMVQDLMTRVTRLDNLDGKLHILNQLSDAELKDLYTGAWFTIYPSFVEGWGLPVAESLVFGRPCIAANTSSIPEVGGDFVWYVDPFNVTEGVDLVTALIANPHRVQLMADKIQAEFKPRTWAQVSQNLLSGFEALKDVQSNAVDVADIALSPGVWYPVGGKLEKGHGSNARERCGIDAMFDEGWYGVEPWGRWLKGQKGSLLKFTRSNSEAAAHIVAFQVQTTNFWRGRRVIITCRETKLQAEIRLPRGNAVCCLVRIVLPQDSVGFEFSVDGVDVGSGGDQRPLSIGLIRFGFAQEKDAIAVAALKEAVPPNLRQISVDAKSFGTVRPVRISKFAPHIGWYKRTAMRLLDDSPRATARRVVGRVKTLLGRD